MSEPFRLWDTANRRQTSPRWSTVHAHHQLGPCPAMPLREARRDRSFSATIRKSRIRWQDSLRFGSGARDAGVVCSIEARTTPGVHTMKSDAERCKEVE